MLTGFYLMATLPFVTDHASHFFCSWWSSDLNLFKDFEQRFPRTSILPGFTFFFYPCFHFALSLYLFLSHCIVCILINYLKSFFRTQRSINESINTSCVCNYGILFFLRQNFTSISSVGPHIAVRKVGQAQSPSFCRQGSWGTSMNKMVCRRGQTHSSICIEDHLNPSEEGDRNMKQPIRWPFSRDADGEGGKVGGHHWRGHKLGWPLASEIPPESISVLPCLLPPAFW